FPATASPPTSRVRVAIVDGSPTETASGVPSGSGHGLAVGAVARSAGCFGAAHCPFIASHEGLRIDGGDFGYQSDVAQAMIAAIRSFLSAGTESRLIVNLSLGWDPSYGSGTGTTIRVPSYAVHTALQVAACEQVLVVAAAGNRARVDGGVGPMYPAGFEPDARRCPGTLAYSPLVHAIGGVLPDDSPLALSRATARPRLAAPASFVTAPLVGGGYADVLSGTSMAAATISGVAALVWSFDPSFSPELVMDRIHAMAVPLGAPADFEHAPWSWTVARVDACAAVAEVAPAASQPEPCSTRAAGQLLAPDFDVVFEAEVPGLRAGPPTPGFSAAATTEVMTDPDVTISPWAGPQPTKPPCPLCTANVENGVTYLYGVIEVAPGSEIISMFVRTCFDACDDGDPVYDVAGELIDGTTLKVELPEVDLANVTSLRVEAKVLDLATDEITIQASEVLAEM
ncbi:S8/S53 family peptidase, partial [Myxococcota bacterium]|nr:S8/S53 family peptidase [Myxococcota bacterium]